MKIHMREQLGFYFGNSHEPNRTNNLNKREVHQTVDVLIQTLHFDEV